MEISFDANVRTTENSAVKTHEEQHYSASANQSVNHNWNTSCLTNSTTIPFKYKLWDVGLLCQLLAKCWRYDDVSQLPVKAL